MYLIDTLLLLDPDGNISDLFIAEDAKIIDSSMVESVRSDLNLKFERNKQEQRRTNPSSLLGEHLWDISEYDKIRVIKIYESNRLIVVLAEPYFSWRSC